jgi:hypothetical protein
MSWTLYLSFSNGKSSQITIDPISTMDVLRKGYLQSGSGFIPHEQQITVFRKDNSGDLKFFKKFPRFSGKDGLTLESCGLKDRDKISVVWQAPRCTHESI